MKKEHKEIIESSGCAEDSQGAQELARDINLAETALAEVNCEELFALFKKAVRDRGAALQVMGILSEHYKGDGKSPLYQSSDAIESMERVSLAAIQLARDVVLKKR